MTFFSNFGKYGTISAGSGVAPILPINQYSGLTLWLRADNVSGSTWTNNSNAGSAGNYTLNNSPTVNSSDGNFNGQASITFNGSNQTAHGPANSNTWLGTNGEYFAYIVFRNHGTYHDGPYHDHLVDSAGNYLAIGFAYNHVYQSGYQNNNIGAGASNTTYLMECGLANQGNMGAVDANFFGDQSAWTGNKQFANLCAVGSNVGSSSGSSYTIDSTTYGGQVSGIANNTGEQYYDGEIAEVIVYNSVPSDWKNRTLSVRSYLNTRYGTFTYA